MTGIKNKIVEELKTMPDKEMSLKGAGIKIGEIDIIHVFTQYDDQLFFKTQGFGVYTWQHLSEEELLKVFDIVIPDLLGI